jgi:hypothetical protein
VTGKRQGEQSGADERQGEQSDWEETERMTVETQGKLREITERRREQRGSG